MNMQQKPKFIANKMAIERTIAFWWTSMYTLAKIVSLFGTSRKKK
jgi:hypothetical protein